MFNVLVTYNSTAWETDQLMRMESDRFKEYSGGPEADTVSLAKPATLKLLEGIPSLLFYEDGATGPTAPIVRYGTLAGIRQADGEVVFRFNEEGRFSRSVLQEFAGRLDIARFEMNRTHWAVKEGGIPTAMIRQLIPYYDVVFSFAGEDRRYVSAVARYLRTHGVRVFYDEYELAHLWGKDLAEHFDMVYGESGRFCVIFISRHYVEKMWTRHERRTALARAIREHGEYILPARFDDSKVDGIRTTVAHISLEGLGPAKFAKEIIKKLRG